MWLIQGWANPWSAAGSPAYTGSQEQLVCNDAVMLQEAAGCPDGSAVRWSTRILGEPTADLFPDVPFGIRWLLVCVEVMETAARLGWRAG